MLSRLIFVTALVLFCGTATPAREGSDSDPLAPRKAEMAERYQQAYDKIVAAQTKPLANTAEEVIDRCIEAMGGREALASLKTMSLTSHGHTVAGRFGATCWMKAPNYLRQERSGGHFIVTDGIDVWKVDGDDWQPTPPGGPVWQQQFSLTLDLVDYEAKGVTYEFAGTHAQEGGAFYRLRKTISTGKEIFIYFNIETSLLSMEEEFGNWGRKLNLFMDYREEGGVLLPHMRVRVADIITTAHVALWTWKVNPPLEDDLFIPPDDR